MTLEAVKALFGQLPPYNPSVMTGATAQSPQEELVSNRMRIRAWSMVASQVPFPISFSSSQPFCSASAQSPLLYVLSSFFPYAPLSSSSAGVKKGQKSAQYQRPLCTEPVICDMQKAKCQGGSKEEGVGGGGGLGVAHEDHAQ